MPLKGLSVLDLGCNEGFFSGEALRQGAARVIGIDASQNFIAKARKRYPQAEFICGSWWDVPKEKFDVIFFLSAIHYEPQQRKFLQKLAHNLTPDGTLILECGIGHVDGKSWYTVQRADGIRRFPSFKMLSAELLRQYTVRHMGKSVLQAGDPVPRDVFHCRLKNSIALLISGRTNSGKSTLAFTFNEQGISAFHTDVLLNRIVHDERYAWSPVAQIAQRWKGQRAINFGELGQEIISAGYVEEIVDIIMLEAPLETEIFCVEGEILCHDQILKKLSDRLNRDGIKTWFISPS